MSDGPVLPYHQGTSSGYSGSEASRERAEHRDSTGLTEQIQARVLRMVRDAEERGLTIADLRDRLPDHHGTLSGALSALHSAERVARLTEKRDRCQVYVTPDHINGRDTKPQGRPGKPCCVHCDDLRKEVQSLNERLDRVAIWAQQVQRELQGKKLR